MTLGEAIALYERCQFAACDVLADPCHHCVLNRRIGDPEDADARGVAYTITPCIFLSELEQVLKDTPAPEVSQRSYRKSAREAGKPSGA